MLRRRDRPHGLRVGELAFSDILFSESCRFLWSGTRSDPREGPSEPADGDGCSGFVLLWGGELATEHFPTLNPTGLDEFL
jgi:hypothetical protein